jgi:tRNA threonylcarbamoyladenosine biosynthesis protein TsaB
MQNSPKAEPMPAWTVAIETVATAGSVALLKDNELVAEAALPPDSRSARTLAAGVQNLWVTAGKPAISLVAVAMGPGSFTGLRVGVTTAKALAYAWQAMLHGVNTLDAIAVQCERSESPGVTHLDVILDAQRQELFVARYHSLLMEGQAQAEWQRSSPDTIISAQDWLASLPPNTQVAGPALTKLRSQLPATISVAPESVWQPRAASIAQLAYWAHQAGATDELWTLVPHYGRPSYAEEKAENRESGVRNQESGIESPPDS